MFDNGNVYWCMLRRAFLCRTGHFCVELGFLCMNFTVEPGIFVSNECYICVINYLNLICLQVGEQLSEVCWTCHPVIWCQLDIKCLRFWGPSHASSNLLKCEATWVYIKTILGIMSYHVIIQMRVYWGGVSPLKFHTKHLTHTSKYVYFIDKFKFDSS